MLTRNIQNPAHHLMALASFIGLALIQMMPVLSDPTGLAIGHPNNDVWNHIWGYGFVGQSIAEGTLPLHTDLMNWPYGGTLWFIDLFGALITLPVTLISGPVAAYNAGLLIQWVLCGVGMYALAWRVTGSIAGAWAAAICYQSMPHLMGQAYNGISETIAAGWLPLALLGIREMFIYASRKNCIVAGLLLGLTALANWYYGLFAGMGLIALCVRSFWRRRGRIPRYVAERGLLFVGVTLLIVGPTFWIFSTSMTSADAIVTRDPQFVWATLVLHNMTDVVSFVRPGKHYSPDLKVLFGEDLLVIVYLGHALIWPALLGFRSELRRRMWSWAGLGMIYFVLCLGPFLFVAGDYLQVLGGWVPLPFLALFKWFPMFSRISHAYRFAVGITLALCMLLAWTIRSMEGTKKPVVSMAIVIASLRVLECFYASPAHFPLPVSNVSVSPAVASLQGGAVLDLPVGRPVLARSQYSMAQLHHLQPSPYGLNDPLPSSLRFNRFLRFLVEMEFSTTASLPAQMPWFDLFMGKEAAMADGLRWIVLHEDSYPSGQFARTARFLDIIATPVRQADGVRVYRLDP